jgi:hypothetical protein
MAAVTAAVVAGVATVAATGMQVAQSQGAFGGGSGSGSQPNVKPMPEDPQDKAMKDYFARMTVANVDKTYPGFGEFLESGGDPAKAKFDLTVPGLKPSEAAALGFVGGKGEDIPEVSQAGLASGDITSLTPAQRIFLAKERAGQAAASGGEAGPWASKVKRLGGKIGRLEDKLATKFTPTPEIEPREQKIQDKLTRLRGKLDTATMAGDR